MVVSSFFEIDLLFLLQESAIFMKKGIIYLALFFLACAPKAKFISTVMPYPPSPRHFGTVLIFLHPPENLTYVEIGFVVGTGRLLDSWTNIIEKMQMEVGLHGANGIILVDRETAINARKIFPVIEYPKDDFGNPKPTKEKVLYGIAIRILP